MATEKDPGTIVEQMNSSAVDAEAELNENIQDYSVQDFVAWFVRWKNKAGYKRLGRLIVEWDKQFKSEAPAPKPKAEKKVKKTKKNK